MISFFQENVGVSEAFTDFLFSYTFVEVEGIEALT